VAPLASQTAKSPVSTLGRFCLVFALVIPVRLPPSLLLSPCAPLTMFICIDRATAIEALRRSQYKFPGRQKIIVSKNWGFTPLRRDEYIKLRQEGRVKVDGAYVQFLSNHGSLEKNMRRFPEAFSSTAEEEAEA
jgi:hypothetical protein